MIIVHQYFKNTYFAAQMKLFRYAPVTLTILLSLLLPYGCREKKNSDTTLELKAYNEARTAQDYNAAVALLLQIAAKDSANNIWVYDSLALYHFTYLTPANQVRNPFTAKYYTEKGLKLNASNFFLLEIKAKLLLEEQKDTQSFIILKDLWQKTGDYTYLWDMTLIEVLRKRINVADSMANTVIASAESATKTVRITDQILQTINAKAAFLYIRATLANIKGDLKVTAESLQEALQIAPNFYLAQKGYYELQQSVSAASKPKQ